MAHTDFYWHKCHCYIIYIIDIPHMNYKRQVLFFFLTPLLVYRLKIRNISSQTLVNVGQTITVPYWVVPVRRRSVCSFYLQIKKINQKKIKKKIKEITFPTRALICTVKNIKHLKLFYCYNIFFIINIASNCLLQLLVSD